MSRILVLTLVAGLSLALGGCGGGDDDAADDPAPTTSSPTPSPTNTGPLPPDLPEDPKAETVTVSGRVSLGVEPGCTLLEANGRLYLLLGSDVAGLKEGAGVRVTGTTAPDVMTTCQQGLPLQVTTLEVIPSR